MKAHNQDGSLNGGLENLEKHINNFRKVFGKETIVAINKFDGDSDEDLNKIKSFCKSLACPAEIANAYMQGGDGCVELAKKVKALCDKKNTPLKFAYNLEDTIKEKILSLAKNIYGASSVEYSPVAKEKIKQFEKLAKDMPICIAKTQYSLSDDDKLLGVPQNFTLHVRDIELKNGAGFIVVIAGKISLMPGLPLEPNSENMTIDKNGKLNLASPI